AGAQGNTALQQWINTNHNLDLRSGLVEIAVDHANTDLEAGHITVDAAMKQATDVASQQGLPHDVGLTALLVDTHGNAKVADALVHDLHSGALVPTPMTNDI